MSYFVIFFCHLPPLPVSFSKPWQTRAWKRIQFLFLYMAAYVYHIKLKSDSHLPKKLRYLLHWKPFKSYEKCFLFHLKSSFRSQDIFNFFYLNFSGLFHHIKNRLDYKDKANFKIHDVTTRLAKICNRHILPNISRSKDNQAMKFGRLIEYNKINIFLQNLYRKWSRETSSRPLIL